MLNAIVDASLRYKVLVLVAFAVLVGLGVMAYRQVVDEAMAQVWTHPVAEAIRLHEDPGVRFVDIRDVRELEREGFDAVVVRRNADQLEPLAEAIRAFCKQRLAPYKFPRWVRFVDDLPKTRNMKVMRRVVRAVWQGSAAPSGATREPARAATGSGSSAACACWAPIPAARSTVCSPTGPARSRTTSS